SHANTGAATEATSVSGNTGAAANAVNALLLGGNGASGGDKARVRSGRAGDAKARQTISGRGNRVTLGSVTGGDSIANGSVNGGAGGDVHSDQSPTAVSGDSGLSRAQSSATNTGNTGPACSTANASPVAASGGSGASGNTGEAKAEAARKSAEIGGKANISACTV